MKIIGNRKERKITFHATAENLKVDMNMSWNKVLCNPPIGGGVYIPKGVYHYKSDKEANKHWLDCLTKGIAKLERQRRDGKVTPAS